MEEYIANSYERLFQTTGIKKEVFDLFLSHGTYRECKDKEVLLEIGSKEQKVFFVLDGVVRLYVEDTKGNEFNKILATTSELISVLHLNLYNEPSREGVQCITESKIIEFDNKELLQLVAENPEVSMLYYMLSIQKYVALEGRNISLISQSAEERYVDLRRQMKQVDNWISQYHIASYLGVTPIQLSRIRKKMIQKA